MIGLAEIRRKAAEHGVGLEVVERDYVLSWLLWGVFGRSALREVGVFKGGTALRKAYFPDYRFSQDIDMTLRRSAPVDELRDMLSMACREATTESGVGFTVVQFDVERDEGGEEAYSARIAYVGPRQQQRNPTRFKVDLTAYERIVLTPRLLPLHHLYSDRCDVVLPTYPLEEMLAEKLRALLTRRRVRHFYDVWFLLKHHAHMIDTSTVREVFAEKCRYKQVAFTDPADFFKPEALAIYSASWQKSLVHQLSHLPDFSTVLAECQTLVRALFA